MDDLAYKETIKAAHKGLLKNNLLLRITEYGYYKKAEGAAAIGDKDNEEFFKNQASESMTLILGYIDKL